MADLAVKSKSSVQVFENGEFGKLEVIEIDGKPYFPATECAKVLGYANTKDAVLRHCKGVVKRDLPTNGGERWVSEVNENVWTSGTYGWNKQQDTLDNLLSEKRIRRNEIQRHISAMRLDVENEF